MSTILRKINHKCLTNNHEQHTIKSLRNRFVFERGIYAKSDICRGGQFGFYL